VIKAANCGVFKLAGPTITDLERAIVRLGSERIGELAGDLAH
jgi:HD-like signal output (HDOD) protein